MTGKQALDFIIEDYQHSLIERYYKTDMPKSTRDKLCKKYDDKFKIIEEDLEVLEILKHLILGIERTFNQKQFNESGVAGTIIKDYFINNDITGKVEKWLKENKNGK